MIFVIIWVSLIPFGTDGGACGYGNVALQFSNGFFAAAVPSLYRQGAGCGACYQVFISFSFHILLFIFILVF